MRTGRRVGLAVTVALAGAAALTWWATRPQSPDRAEVGSAQQQSYARRPRGGAGDTRRPRAGTGVRARGQRREGGRGGEVGYALVVTWMV
jgi:hypothetical protein